MKSYELQHVDEEFKGLVQTERPKPVPDADEVVVEIHACSLNHRDLLLASTGLGQSDDRFPIVPLSDGAGEVIEIGDDVDRVALGERVLSGFAPDWNAGAPTQARIARTTGGTVDGVLREYATLPADSLTRVPEHLSYEAASTLPCAGLTAWRVLVEDGGLTAGELVLALGTGGVSIFALQFAEMHGADTIVTSSSDAKREQAAALGASRTVNYESTSAWGQHVQELVDGDGVDHVIEVGGPGTLKQSLTAIKYDGTVHLIGVLDGIDGQINPAPVQSKNVTLNGVSGVGSQAMFARMVRAIETTGMEPVVDRVFGFDEARDAYGYLQRSDHLGKVVISVS